MHENHFAHVMHEPSQKTVIYVSQSRPFEKNSRSERNAKRMSPKLLGNPVSFDTKTTSRRSNDYATDRPKSENVNGFNQSGRCRALRIVGRARDSQYSSSEGSIIR